MCFNYTGLKSRVRTLCRELDEYTLLPAQSPYLEITENDGQYVVGFNDETLYFSKKDTKLLPLRNTTVEEYSHYLLSRLVQDRAFLILIPSGRSSSRYHRGRGSGDRLVGSQGPGDRD